MIGSGHTQQPGQLSRASMMRETAPRSLAWVSFLFPAVLIALDQLSKLLMRTYFSENVVCNTAGALGVSLSPLLLIVFSSGILLLLMFWQLYQEPINGSLAWILAGGAGNLIDRMTQGCVTDFIHIFSFPIFNLADIYLTIGAFFLVLFIWRSERLDS